MVNIIIKTASATISHTNILRIIFNAFICSLLGLSPAQPDQLVHFIEENGGFVLGFIDI